MNKLTAKLTMTKRLPKVVTTIQTAIEIAIRIVRAIPKGAGQHAGPQSWIERLSRRETKELYKNILSLNRNIINDKCFKCF